jgi:hypothetical protein
MKQFLPLFFFAICLSFSASAQRTITPGTANKPAIGSANHTIVFPEIGPLLSGEKGIIDTFLAPAFDQNCALTPSIIGTAEGGFVTGTNGYIDIAKLQRINFPESYDFDLTTISAALILDSIASTDNLLDDVMIVAKVYADTDNGSVGEFLGDSDSIRIGDLGLTDSTINFINFPFSTPVAFAATESIIVGIDFINVYLVDEGNVGIISTESGCGDGTNAFDVFLDDDNNEVFTTIYDTWDMLNIEMYMNVVIDREPAVATRTPVANYSATAFPNPASEQLNISFNTTGNSQMAASLISADGRILREQTVAPGASLRSASFDVSALPAGVYLYQITGPSGVETGRVIIR